VAFWGFFDKNTSVSTKDLDPGRNPWPLLYDENFDIKPARGAVIRALEHAATLRATQHCSR